MKKESHLNINIRNLVYLLLYTIIIIISSIKIYIKISKKKKNRQKEIKKEEIIDLTIAPSHEILLPPSEIRLKNLSYCPNYTPKDKEFSEMPIKYKNGVSIIVTAYKMKNFIKETLDSISNQTYFINNSNYEILIGVDGCEETLNYLYTIMENYSNLRIFMMEKNYGTFITTNTMMSIAKYDNLIRFDSDDIMLPNLIEITMKEMEKGNIDKVKFLMENFGDSNLIRYAAGQFLIKHWVIDYFGGFMPWICEADAEFYVRTEKFIVVKNVPIILMMRRIHENNLTINKNTNSASFVRKWNQFYLESFSRKITNINDAVIIRVVGDYKEIL